MKIVLGILSLAITLSSVQVLAQSRLSSAEEKYLSLANIGFEQNLMRSPDGKFILEIDIARIGEDFVSGSLLIRVIDSNSNGQKFFDVREQGSITSLSKSKYCVGYRTEETGSINDQRSYIYAIVDLSNPQVPQSRIFKIKQSRALANLSSIQQVCKGTLDLKNLSREDWEISEFDLTN